MEGSRRPKKCSSHCLGVGSAVGGLEMSAANVSTYQHINEKAKILAFLFALLQLRQAMEAFRFDGPIPD